MVSYNGLPYYKRYPADFLKGTAGMPFELKGAYAVLLDMIYMHGGDVPDDSRYISGQLGVSVRKWKIIRSGLIDAGKLIENGASLSNYRAVSELESSRKFQDQQRENRTRPNKNNYLEKPRSHQSESESEVKEDTNVSSKKKRGFRLPDDWVLPDEFQEWALSQGWSIGDVKNEAEKFRDYWHSLSGQRATKLDWLATWRNWMRNSKTPKATSSSEVSEGGLTFYADWINGEKILPPSAISTSIASRCVEAGLVTPQRMRERGIT